MCTAISWHGKDHYFGRNLDLEYHYDEEVTITSRSFPLQFRMEAKIREHYAMIGTATVVDGYPLYYDATNEHGLSAAALNFPGNAVYHSPSNQHNNVAPFELIPWVLAQCKSVEQVKNMLKNVNIVNIPFNQQWPLTPLHWIFADEKKSLVAEPMESELVLYADPVGVLTNNPTFDYHLHNLCNYMNLTPEEPENHFSSQITLMPYSRGMGAIGLPGDLSSASRFVKASFTKLNAKASDNEIENVGQFFHILGAVEQQSGCVVVNGGLERTIYTSCCNTDRGIYYYTTYENRQITAVQLMPENVGVNYLTRFPLRHEQSIYYENKRPE